MSLASGYIIINFLLAFVALDVVILKNNLKVVFWSLSLLLIVFLVGRISFDASYLNNVHVVAILLTSLNVVDGYSLLDSQTPSESFAFKNIITGQLVQLILVNDLITISLIVFGILVTIYCKKIILSGYYKIDNSSLFDFSFIITKVLTISFIIFLTTVSVADGDLNNIKITNERSYVLLVIMFLFFCFQLLSFKFKKLNSALDFSSYLDEGLVFTNIVLSVLLFKFIVCLRQLYVEVSYSYYTAVHISLLFFSTFFMFFHLQNKTESSFWQSFKTKYLTLVLLSMIGHIVCLENSLTMVQIYSYCLFILSGFCLFLLSDSFATENLRPVPLIALFASLVFLNFTSNPLNILILKDKILESLWPILGLEFLISSIFIFCAQNFIRKRFCHYGYRSIDRRFKLSDATYISIFIICFCLIVIQ